VITKVITVSACLLVLRLLLCTQPVAAGEPDLTGTAKVIDGDTIEIVGQRIRIMDIDAPERTQPCASADGANWPCGIVAADELAAMVQGKQVTCGLIGRPSGGLQLARCAAGGVDLANWIVAAGWAVPARNCKCEITRELSRTASANGLGIWTSDFQQPWDWRKSH
jgi:endonuclease YncB( thermonuclease family)